MHWSTPCKSELFYLSSGILSDSLCFSFLFQLAIWPCAQTGGAACHTADSRLLPLVYAPPNTLQPPPPRYGQFFFNFRRVIQKSFSFLSNSLKFIDLRITIKVNVAFTYLPLQKTHVYPEKKPVLHQKKSKEPSKDRRHRSSSNQPFGHSHFRHYIEFSVPCGPR